MINLDDFRLSRVISLIREMKAEDSGRSPVRIAFLRNITIDPVVPYLEFLCLNNGLRPEVLMDEYNNIMQEVLDPSSELYRFEPSLVMVASGIRTTLPGLPRTTVRSSRTSATLRSTLICAPVVKLGLARPTNCSAVSMNGCDSIASDSAQDGASFTRRGSGYGKTSLVGLRRSFA